MNAIQAIMQLPLEPVPPSSLTGGRDVSSLQTTQLPLEPVPSSSLTGGRMIMMSSTLEVVAVKESIDGRMSVDLKKKRMRMRRMIQKMRQEVVRKEVRKKLESSEVLQVLVVLSLYLVASF